MDSRRLVTGVMLALMAASAAAQKAVLVELFTSEGCSSCPPADALLRLVNGSQTNKGQLIVGISEHVTYWNSLGWSDPFSSSAYTERQNAYSERFHLEGPYTPQMVINGAEQIVGSDRAGLLRAVEKEDAESPRMSLRIVSLSVAGSTLTVNFSTSGDLPAQGADLIAVLADDADQSSVLRGENSGRTLGTCRRSPIHHQDCQGEGCRRTDGRDPDSGFVSDDAGASSHPVCSNPRHRTGAGNRY